MDRLVREAAVQGMFYPASRDELRLLVTSYLNAAHPAAEYDPKALIVPHAGYIYSGPVAASAYRLLSRVAARIARVVLVGPAHRMAFKGVALSRAHSFSTPLGEVPVDLDALKKIDHFDFAHYLDQAHSMEHSLEVHLPFLQTVLKEFSLVPILVGDASAAQVGAVIEAFWPHDDTLVVVSSDLSHYHDYITARRMDQSTTKAIEELRLDDIQYEDACGRNPIKGLLWVASKNDLHVHCLDLRNSGDTAGSKDRVVGYGAYCVE